MVNTSAFDYINVLEKAADASWLRDQCIANNIANVVYGIAIAVLLKPVVIWLLPSSLEMEFFILLLQSVISTLVVLVVAEFLPKILFRINPNAILSFFAFPTVVCYYILYPLTLVYSGIAYLIIRVFFGMRKYTRKNAGMK